MSEHIASRAELRRTNEELCRSIPEPEFTPTWHPYSHAKIIDVASEAVETIGLKVVNKTYSLTQDGGNMFALWVIENGFEGKHLGLGFRNSVNMMMSVGFCAMLTVIVCTNQVTTGQFEVLRKHTSGLSFADLKGMAIQATENALAKAENLNQWHEGLHDYPIIGAKAERLTIQAMRKKVLPPSKFKEFDELFLGQYLSVKNGGRKTDYEPTLYGFHGALTQLIRDHNLITNVSQNKKITDFINTAKGKSN